MWVNALLISQALMYINLPYFWGAQGYEEKIDSMAFDCSGLIVKVFQDYGIFSKGVDKTAQGLHDWCLEQEGSFSSYACDSLLFFGRNRKSITHVAISMGVIDGKLHMINASGGGRETKNMTKAEILEKGAMVKKQLVSSRRDLVTGIKVPFKI